jgi:hypothetical protein
MFSEILKIVPKLDDGDLGRMERSLNDRFSRVAKKFGSGLLNIIKGGGIAGVAIALIDKILNPINEIKESIEKTLNASDQLSTNAKQFGTTSGKLFRLQNLAQAQGIAPDEIFMLIQKFQTAVANAKADPTQRTAVSNFVDRPDTAEAFFEFIQAIQKLDKSSQLIAQQEVFGEKQIGKMAQFIQNAPKFAEMLQLIGGPGDQELTRAIDKNSNLKGFFDAGRANIAAEDVVRKSKGISQDKIQALLTNEFQQTTREDDRLANFKALQGIQTSTDKIAATLENAYGKLAPALNAIIRDLIGDAGKIAKSRAIRLGKTPKEE